LNASLQSEAADMSSAQPSPLAGEGGERRSRSPGEGAFSAERKPKRPAMPRPAAGVKSNARGLRKDMTEAEQKLWSILRNRRLVSLKFRRQVPIGPYVADFLSFHARLIVEADGSQHAEPARDEERNAWLTAQGFRILRFWNSDILNNPDGVTARVMELAPEHREIAR
jgi:very-short-patch-repair endonuclease